MDRPWGRWSRLCPVHRDYEEIIRRRFLTDLPQAGPSKLCTAAEAVERHTRPGGSIHLSTTHARPYGLGNELVRRYWGKDARLEISLLNVGETWVALFLGNILRKAVTTFAGDVWPYPSPSPVISERWLTGKVEIEHWSILSHTLRLLAGALRLPFLPTRSLVGSTMAEDNARAGSYREMEDPFGSAEKVGLVKAYRPGVCFIHVPACDVAGNAILTSPVGEGALGAYAAQEGVVVSAEKIVSTQFLREHSHLVKIPAHIVRAVVEMPLGGHPRGLTNLGVPELSQYADDYAFLFSVRQAARQGEAALLKWVDEWILSCPTQEAFLKKLGEERIGRLRAKAAPGHWKIELEDAAAGKPGDAGAAAKLGTDPAAFIGAEMMIVASGRKMADLARRLDLKHILAGVGAANLAAWLCRARLQDEGRSISCMAEIGYLGYEPRPADPYIFNFKNTPTCVSTSGILDILGTLVPDGGNLGSLGAAQVDRWGNVNSTCIPGKMHFLGSGGGNDVASGAKAVAVTAYLGKDKFKEKVDYITSPGKNVRLVASDYGIFEKPVGAGELELTGYYTAGPTGFARPEQAVEKIRSLTGWSLKVRERLEAVPPPTKDELYLLRLFDPYGQFLR